MNDIPDEVPDKIMDSGRAPSYKAIAIAILQNDVTLKSLGFEGKYTEWHNILKNKINDLENKQMRLLDTATHCKKEG